MSDDEASAQRGRSQATLEGGAAAPPVLPDQTSGAPAAQAAPAVKPPVLSRLPSQDRQFPCSQCGAKLNFDPTQRALTCPFCGHVEQIAPDSQQAQEHDYAAALAKQAAEPEPLAGRSQEVRCAGCGAIVLLEDNVVTDRCPFCDNHLSTVDLQPAQRQINPQYLLPFAVSQREAVPAFNKWIRGRWFAPGNLRQLANLGQLSGIYLPFWTYDAMTYSHYTGERGDDYWETESYTTTENGETVTKTRQVLRTRWRRVSGEVDHFFDDVLICASKSLPSKRVELLEPWDLPNLETFRPEFLAGFKTERYAVDLSEGFTLAQQRIAPDIRQLCERDIGGDHQRVHTVNTQYVGTTFKYLLLPLWLAAYRYAGKPYQISINASTGEVQGTRPYSWIKITAFVLLCLIVLVAVILMIRAYQH